MLESKSVEVPSPQREEPIEAHLERILVRVCEKLADDGIEAAYSTFTGFCRRHCIGATPKQPAGRYHFMPGEEMQHDTSPHLVTVGGLYRSAGHDARPRLRRGPERVSDPDLRRGQFS